MAEQCPAQSESLQPHTERRSRHGPKPYSAEADVYAWRYALLVVHARKEEYASGQYLVTSVYQEVQEFIVSYFIYTTLITMLQCSSNCLYISLTYLVFINDH